MSRVVCNKLLVLNWQYAYGTNNSYTAKPCFLELEGTEKKLRDIQRFQISKVKYLWKKWLELPNHFDLFMVFDISGVRDTEVQLYLKLGSLNQFET